ncbi:hypothetical protein [Bradyrhizobium sp. BR 10261]|uniref:hypothetical protein n=1 Tax=Bradyrhizobium sp. BR 10261 TaxID=2749992 RepID=UPI001C64CE7A|nr:hypothetical protein [Bradyrhizobium sp. BR 10261]
MTTAKLGHDVPRDGEDMSAIARAMRWRSLRTLACGRLAKTSLAMRRFDASDT